MATTDAVWQAATSTEDGKLPIKRCIRRYTTQNVWLSRSTKNVALFFFVIFTDIRASKTFLCMGATTRRIRASAAFFLSSYQK